jgi:uncharacterized protein (TIGR02271 family)
MDQSLDSKFSTDDATLVLPVVAEQLEVSKRQVTSGKGVRIDKRVIEQPQHVDLTLETETVQIERIAFDLEVDPAAPPQPRHEGDTFIIPVLEEVAVLQKQLRLKEEVRITRSLRREEITTTRLAGDAASLSTTPSAAAATSPASPTQPDP